MDAGYPRAGYKNLDVTLAMFFRLTERFRIEFKMEAYNVSNTFTGANPDLTVTRSTFGRVLSQPIGVNGREFQYNLKLIFRFPRTSSGAGLLRRQVLGASGWEIQSPRRLVSTHVPGLNRHTCVIQ